MALDAARSRPAGQSTPPGPTGALIQLIDTTKVYHAGHAEQVRALTR